MSEHVMTEATEATKFTVLRLDQLGLVLVFAVRYALGRRTYASCAVPEAVRDAWDAIPEQEQQVIRRDIEQALEGAERAKETLGDQCDHDAWRDLLSWITTQGELTHTTDIEEEGMEAG